MTFLNMATLVFPVSKCLGLGLYVELFLFSALTRDCRGDEEKESFQLKNLKALCVRNAVSRKKSHITNIFLCSTYGKISNFNAVSILS